MTSLTAFVIANVGVFCNYYYATSQYICKFERSLQLGYERMLTGLEYHKLCLI